MLYKSRWHNQWIHFEWRLRENRTEVQWDCDILKVSSSLVRYSFSVPPKLDLHVRPKLGEREVTLCHVTEWIEKKLQDEFQVKEKGGGTLLNSVICYVLISSLTFPTYSPESLCPAKHGWHLFTPDALGGGLSSRGAASVISVTAVAALSELLRGIHGENSGRLEPVPRWLKETQNHRRRRRRWRSCASKVKQSLMFTCRVIHMRLYTHFFAF